MVVDIPGSKITKHYWASMSVEICASIPTVSLGHGA
jgi:hypothetical protein